MSSTITASDVAAGYGNHVIWQHASFSIAPGEFVGLLGSNGAGKTTLFRMLLGLTKPLAGTLEIFDASPRQGNARIGYVPQRHSIDTDTKIESLEYVRLGLNGDKWGIGLPYQAHTERERAMQALCEVDAEQFAHRPLSSLSGGEQQRVFLAQALVGNPELLLLDEPLANLDLRRETQLIKLVHSVAKQQAMAVLLIAHDINPLLPFVDRIIYIAGGKVAAGKPRDIVTSETLSALYNAPIEVLKDSKGRFAVLGIGEGEQGEHHA